MKRNKIIMQDLADKSWLRGDEPKRNTRAQARRLFPGWSRHKLAEWVLARLRCNGATWKFPIGEKYVEAEAPEFLRALPHGASIELVDDLRDKRVKATRAVVGLVRGKRYINT